MNDELDLVVIGAGIAGFTAATFAGRLGLRVALVDQASAGGQVVNTERIENLPGFPDGIGGLDLGARLLDQAEAAGVEFLMDRVQSLQLEEPFPLVRCVDQVLAAPAVIVAAGSDWRALGIPGERELLRRGVSHCASCDGLLFRGARVCVVGGGDSAIDEALTLCRYAERVTIYHRGARLDAQPALLDKAAAEPNLEIVLNTTVEEICGDGMVAAVRLRDSLSGAARLEPVAGVFIYVGLEPNTAFLRGVVALDPTGHIETDIMMRTSVPGIYAAGDIRRSSVAQLAAAAGDGATAATAAFRYLKGLTGE
jgi:thioredoxin reductase (NADPH)